MKKRIQKAVGKTLPFLALSLFLVFLLSWTFVPYTRENVARHDFTGYTAGIKNNALQQEYPDDFLHLVWQPTDEETAEILTFLRQLRPVQRMISIRARALCPNESGSGRRHSLQWSTALPTMRSRENIQASAAFDHLQILDQRSDVKLQRICLLCQQSGRRRFHGQAG